MNCPYCGFHFKLLAANGDHIPDLAPMLCEGCAGVSLLEDGVIRQLREGEMEAIQRSEAWGFLDRVRKVIQEHLKIN